jgi:putative hydrolase of the HAD superfamily
MTIKALFFDFGGVLLRHADGVDHRAIEAAHGLEERTLMRCLYRESRYHEFQVGACTHEEWQESIRTSAVTLLGEERAAAVLTAYEKADRPLNDDLLALIGRLRERGYRTGIISNTIPGMMARISENVPHIVPLFDVFVGSGDLRMAKPDPGIFRHALNEMRVPPEAATFADDVKSYAEAATAVGMRGIHFTGFDQFVAEIRALGVDV